MALEFVCDSITVALIKWEAGVFETGYDGVIGYGSEECSGRVSGMFYVLHHIYRNIITYIVFPVDSECKVISDSNLNFP